MSILLFNQFAVLGWMKNTSRLLACSLVIPGIIVSWRKIQCGTFFLQRNWFSRCFCAVPLLNSIQKNPLPVHLRQGALLNRYDLWSTWLHLFLSWLWFGCGFYFFPSPPSLNVRLWHKIACKHWELWNKLHVSLKSLSLPIPPVTCPVIVPFPFPVEVWPVTYLILSLLIYSNACTSNCSHVCSVVCDWRITCLLLSNFLNESLVKYSVVWDNWEAGESSWNQVYRSLSFFC